METLRTRSTQWVILTREAKEVPGRSSQDDVRRKTKKTRLSLSNVVRKRRPAAPTKKVPYHTPFSHTVPGKHGGVCMNLQTLLSQIGISHEICLAYAPTLVFCTYKGRLGELLESSQPQVDLHETLMVNLRIVTECLEEM